MFAWSATCDLDGMFWRVSGDGRMGVFGAWFCIRVTTYGAVERVWRELGKREWLSVMREEVGYYGFWDTVGHGAFVLWERL